MSNIKTFRDGETLCLTVIPPVSEKDTAKITTFIVTMLNEETIDTTVTIHKGSDGCAVTINGGDTEKLITLLDAEAAPDVTETAPVESKPTEKIVRLPSGKYKGLTPKQCVEKDKMAAVAYLQKSVIDMEGHMPEAMETEIRKQIRAYMHRSLYRIKDPAGWSAGKDRNGVPNCDTFLKIGFLILPNSELAGILECEDNASLQAFWQKATSLSYRERQKITAAIINAFSKK